MKRIRVRTSKGVQQMNVTPDMSLLLLRIEMEEKTGIPMYKQECLIQNYV